LGRGKFPILPIGALGSERLGSRRIQADEFAGHVASTVAQVQRATVHDTEG
jgi:hypothetical protein